MNNSASPTETLDVAAVSLFAWAWVEKLNAHLSKGWGVKKTTSRGLNPEILTHLSESIAKDVLSAPNPHIRVQALDQQLLVLQSVETMPYLPSYYITESDNKYTIQEALFFKALITDVDKMVKRFESLHAFVLENAPSIEQRPQSHGL